MSANKILKIAAPKGSTVLNIFDPNNNVEVCVVVRKSKGQTITTNQKTLISLYDAMFKMVPSIEYVKSKI